MRFRLALDKIFYGAHGSDEPFYPDCRREFYEAFEIAARLGTSENIKIHAPFSGKRKSEVIKKGVELGVPFEFTWSCYREADKHCGECESCANRKKAFQEAGIADPTKYEETNQQTKPKKLLLLLLLQLDFLKRQLNLSEYGKEPITRWNRS